MNLKWFASKTVRNAGEMAKHVQKILNAQRDILTPPAVTAVETALSDLKIATRGADDATVRKQMENLETVATKWLKPYPNAGIRENVEVLLVALAVAMAIRTFIAQPFKIPTGSMQPTLFGVTPSPGPFAGNQPDLQVPGRLARFIDFWVHGNSYYNIVAPEDGELQAVKPPQHFLVINLKQEYEFNNHWYTIWFPGEDLFQRAGYRMSYAGAIIDAQPIKAGEPIVRLKVVAGDHLFVDRVSYNFRHPSRGEIIVFETRGIETLPQDQFYIKRLVALGGEKVQIGDDRHLLINGKRLDKSTPHFENVYSFDPAQPPQESHYSGHLNQVVANKYHQYYNLAPLFPDQSAVYQLATNHFMVMGDNTCNSSDSRTWGDFSRTNVIGKYFLVYWPISSRFGWNVR